MKRYLHAAAFVALATPALADQATIDRWAAEAKDAWYVVSPSQGCRSIDVFSGAKDPDSLEKVLRTAGEFKERTEAGGGAWAFKLTNGVLLVAKGSAECKAWLKDMK